jgi:malate/lactate dehydrogenase
MGGMPLDLMQASTMVGFDSDITGTTEYADTQGSDIVVVTAGIPRKPGMSRDDLLSTNAKIVGLLKTGSAYFAPAAATAQMVEAIVPDKKRLIPCAAYCDREYLVGGYCVGVPAILGRAGVERVVELELDAQERANFQKSVDAVKTLVNAMNDLLSNT